MIVIRYIHLICVLLLFSTSSYAEHVDPRELQLKSAFIYKIAKFVVWPPTVDVKNNQTFNICVADNHEFTESLNASTQSRTIHNKTIRIWNVLSVDTIDFCQIIYFHQIPDKKTRDYFDKINDLPILTIGSQDSFSELGGIIRFIQRKNNIGFEINNSLAKQNGLVINAHLLRLSKVR